ncbi:glycosyltransferase involved in cell wall biosynthesis [Flavobacterium sp. 270]|uniref:glycosyltransferase family 4 protein n=1 Tax=Flavobacterium sp. 270 TaxID=2512114 RepID=UPI00106577F1|nr:glycosyltransferase family 4 protein [Flavobacterium sp. 270]TDW47120.1 glycosyltransferase involved in cell wall biosynthesis [Flavobacterium sp. 270]
MNVSIIISDISKTGGTERAVVTLANILSEKYKSVTIVSLTRTQNKGSYYAIDNRVKLSFLDNEPLPLKLSGKIRWSINTVLSLRNYLKKNKTNLIISTGHNNNWLLPFMRLNKKMKIIACEHIVYSSIPKISRIFMRLTYRFLDKIVVLSESAKVSFHKYSEVVVIPNAIPFKTKKESQLIRKQILMVGRLSPEKGLERLVSIAIDLKKKFPDWKIVVLGDGPEMIKIEKSINETDLNDFLVLKGATKDVEKYYLDSSIYIMTSHFEAFPMVLLEAQSFGLPIVAFNCPEGPSEIIRDGHNGFLVENGNIDEFSQKVEALIESKTLRDSLGRNAKRNSGKFSEKKIMEKWISLIDNEILTQRY